MTYITESNAFWKRVCIVMALVVLAMVAYMVWPDKKNEHGVLADPLMLRAKLDSMSRQYDTLKNKLGQTVATNEVLRTKDQDQIKALSDSYFNLQDKYESKVKEVKSLTIVKQRVEVRDHFIPFDTSNHPIAINGRADSIAVPQVFSKEDSTVRIYGTVMKGGVRIDSSFHSFDLVLRNTVSKTGLFGLGPKKHSVQAITSDARARIAGLAGMEYQDRPNWWLSWGKPVLAAAVASAATYYIVK